MSSDKHDKLTYFLIDRSDPFEDEAGFRQTVEAVKSKIEPGERLIVGVSTGQASDTKVLLDIVKPEQSMWVSTLKIRAAEKTFNECVNGLVDTLLANKESYKSSALLETLGFISKVMSSDPAVRKRAVLYSDMMQNSPSLSFYAQKDLQPAVLLGACEREQLIWKFPGVEVYVAGTSNAISDKRNRQLEAFWTEYFSKSGGVVKFFGPVLLAG